MPAVTWNWKCPLDADRRLTPMHKTALAGTGQETIILDERFTGLSPLRGAGSCA